MPKREFTVRIDATVTASSTVTVHAKDKFAALQQVQAQLDGQDSPATNSLVEDASRQVRLNELDYTLSIEN